MGRREDDLRKYVKTEGNNGWQCNFCGKRFTGGATRIRAHLSGNKGQGIAVCQKVPDEVRREASRHDDKRTATNMGSTSNPQGGENEMLFPEGVLLKQKELMAWKTFDETDLAPENLVNYGNTAFEKMDKLSEEMEHLIYQAEDIEEQSDYLQRQSQKRKKRKKEVENWLRRVKSIRKRVDEMRESVDKSELANRVDLEGPILELNEEVTKLIKLKPCEGSLTLDVECAEQPCLVTHELVGQKFQSNFDKIWELINNEEVKIIGVSGMGGVGKTTLISHIHDQIAKTRDIFNSVYWVTVSQDFSITKLQHDIARKINLVLGEESEEQIRAARLKQALREKKRSVLILDDVWNKIDLNKVGIPLEKGGIKLILTSRSSVVCHRTGCASNDDIIKVESLSREEAWKLFSFHLGINETPATLDPEVLYIAKSVAKECKGLPLGLKVLATTMKGVEDIHQWRYALTELQNSTLRERDVEEEVFKVLRFSYDRLNDILQKCFLYCSLYPEDYEIDCEELIEKFVHERLINGGGKLEEMYDEGQSILRKLVGCSLLEDCKGRRVKMHDLLRDMACRTRGYMVKSGKGFEKIPSEWATDLEKVSLMSNWIEQIPNDLSPRCPQLSTLILSENILSSVPICFFLHMPALTVLDLSRTYIQVLPNSISDLKSLVSLLLDKCVQLEYVPPLGNLQELSTLVITETAIKQPPEGLETLLNLKWLTLYYNSNLDMQPGSVLSNLINLQYLAVDLQCFTLQLEDLERMSNLEHFEGFFNNLQDLNDFVSRILDKYPRFKHYCLHLGDEEVGHLRCKFSSRRCVAITCSCQYIELMLPKSINQLLIGHNYQLDGCLCHVLSFDSASTLESCYVNQCTNLESMFFLSCSCSFCSNVQNLRRLCLRDLYNLVVLWKENKEDDIAECLSTPSSAKFPCLTHIVISRCINMEKLLTVRMLAHLPNLVKIHVKSCWNMKEIFSDQESNKKSPQSQSINSNVNDSKEILLPKLEELRLDDLPKLKRVCEGIMACDSFKKLFIKSCPGLERMPDIQSRSQIQYDCDRVFDVSDCWSIFEDEALREFDGLVLCFNQQPIPFECLDGLCLISKYLKDR